MPPYFGEVLRIGGMAGSLRKQLRQFGHLGPRCGRIGPLKCAHSERRPPPLSRLRTAAARLRRQPAHPPARRACAPPDRSRLQTSAAQTTCRAYGCPRSKGRTAVSSPSHARPPADVRRVRVPPHPHRLNTTPDAPSRARCTAHSPHGRRRHTETPGAVSSGLLLGKPAPLGVKQRGAAVARHRTLARRRLMDDVGGGHGSVQNRPAAPAGQAPATG